MAGWWWWRWNHKRNMRHWRMFYISTWREAWKRQFHLTHWIQRPKQNSFRQEKKPATQKKRVRASLEYQKKVEKDFFRAYSHPWEWLIDDEAENEAKQSPMRCFFLPLIIDEFMIRAFGERRELISKAWQRLQSVLCDSPREGKWKSKQQNEQNSKLMWIRFEVFFSLYFRCFMMKR